MSKYVCMCVPKKYWEVQSQPHSNAVLQVQTQKTRRRKASLLYFSHFIKSHRFLLTISHLPKLITTPQKGPSLSLKKKVCIVFHFFPIKVTLKGSLGMFSKTNTFNHWTLKNKVKAFFYFPLTQETEIMPNGGKGSVERRKCRDKGRKKRTQCRGMF